MCGRLVLTSNYREKIKAIFDAIDSDEWLPPRYNITPGQRIPVLNQAAPSTLRWINWGHQTAPRAGHDTPSRLLINARGETVDRLPTFRDAFVHRRCIVLADGFYEWKRAGVKRPQPFFFARRDLALLPLAGLILEGSSNTGPGAVVITTEANALMHEVHDRMPVIFTPETARAWLEPDASPGTLMALLQPFPSGDMSSHPVSDRVNRATSEGPSLIEPVRIVEQTDLF